MVISATEMSVTLLIFRTEIGNEWFEKPGTLEDDSILVAEATKPDVDGKQPTLREIIHERQIIRKLKLISPNIPCLQEVKKQVSKSGKDLDSYLSKSA